MVSEITLLNPATLVPPLSITVVVDEAGLSKVSDFFLREKAFTLDTETNVVKDLNERKIRLIQVGNKQEQYIIDLMAFAGSRTALEAQGSFVPPQWSSSIVDCLQPVLDSNTHLKIGVGLDFDYTVLSWNLGIQLWNVYDCHLAEKVIYAGRVHFMAKDFWGMKHMIARYGRLEIDKTSQTSFDLESPLTEAQITYAALDCRLPFAIKGGQSKLIETAKLATAVQIENDAIPAFCDMGVYGFELSPSRWLAIVEENEALLVKHVAALDVHFVPIVGEGTEPTNDLVVLEQAWKAEPSKEARAALRDSFYKARKARATWEREKGTWQGKAAINYDSPHAVLKAFRLKGYSAQALPSTDEQFLKKFTSDPAISALLDHRGTAKSLSTYGRVYLEQYVSKLDGRVHPNFNQLGAETGRTSCLRPNLQNLPRGAAVRSCFVARAGHSLITADYNGCELRILAELSGEQSWIDAFNKGWDVHSVGAELIFGALWKSSAEPSCAYYKDGGHQKCGCKAHKRLRDNVKALNFGIAYGMEHKKLSEDLGISIDEAKELLALYRKTFARVTTYLKLSGESAKTNFESRTICGRRRLFNKPSGEMALKMAQNRLKKEGKAGPPSFNDINRAIRSMMGSIEREGKNTPIQGANADMIKLAMGAAVAGDFRYLWHRLREYGARLVNMVHDELVVECPDEYVAEVREIVMQCMQRAGEDFVKSVKMTAEASVGIEWSK